MEFDQENLQYLHNRNKESPVSSPVNQPKWDKDVYKPFQTLAKVENFLADNRTGHQSQPTIFDQYLDSQSYQKTNTINIPSLLADEFLGLDTNYSHQIQPLILKQSAPDSVLQDDFNDQNDLSSSYGYNRFTNAVVDQQSELNYS